jgi:stage V sporulation protein S
VDVLKVSSKSNPNAVAGALAGIIREQGSAVKAVAIARGFVAPSGVELTCIPAFADIEINGEERTAIRLLVEPRDMHR